MDKPATINVNGHEVRVPPHLLGEVDRHTSWGRGIEQMERGFCRAIAEAANRPNERAIPFNKNETR